MLHAVEEWSRRNGWLQHREPRSKILVAGVAVIIINYLPLELAMTMAAVLVGVAASTRVPPAGLLARAAVVLPFTAMFSLISWLAGDVGRAVSLPVKAYSAALAAALLASTTPAERLFGGLRRLGMPLLLVEVTRFVYRYLFVIAAQVQRMRAAAQARGAAHSWLAVAGSVAVLFAKSYQRAEGIERARLARGYAGGAR